VASCRTALPGSPKRRAPSPPAFRQVCDLTQGGITRIHPTEPYDSGVGRIVTRTTQKLPATVIGIVRNLKDRSAFKHLPRGDRGCIGLSANGQSATISPRVRPPNDMRISCRRSCPRPHKPTLPLAAPSEGAARSEPRARRPVGCMRGLGGGRLGVQVHGPGLNEQAVAVRAQKGRHVVAAPRKRITQHVFRMGKEAQGVLLPPAQADDGKLQRADHVGDIEIVPARPAHALRRPIHPHRERTAAVFELRARSTHCPHVNERRKPAGSAGCRSGFRTVFDASFNPDIRNGEILGALSRGRDRSSSPRPPRR
jgi:hypothetical protein